MNWLELTISWMIFASYLSQKRHVNDNDDDLRLISCFFLLNFLACIEHNRFWLSHAEHPSRDVSKGSVYGQLARCISSRYSDLYGRSTLAIHYISLDSNSRWKGKAHQGGLKDNGIKRFCVLALLVHHLWRFCGLLITCLGCPTVLARRPSIYKLFSSFSSDFAVQSQRYSHRIHDHTILR